MGLGYSFDQLVNGNFANAFNGIWVSDDQLADSQATTDKLTTAIQNDYANGLINSDQQNAAIAEIAPNTDSSDYWTDSGANPSPLDVFQSGVTSDIQSGTSKVLGLAINNIPWQVYILLFGLLLIWLYPIWKPFATSLMKKG